MRLSDAPRSLAATARRIPPADTALGVTAIAVAVVGWAAVVLGDRGMHGVIAAAAFTVAAGAVVVRRVLLWWSAGLTVVAFAVLGLSGSADALGVFPLIVCVPLTVAAVTGYAPRRRDGRVALAVACAATPLSPAVTISASPLFATGLHVAVLFAVYLWASRRRFQRDALEADRAQAVALAASAERQRIAADLHDGLGHALTAIRAKASTAAALAARRPETAVEALQVISELSRESLAELRRTVGEIADTTREPTTPPATDPATPDEPRLSNAASTSVARPTVAPTAPVDRSVAAVIGGAERFGRGLDVVCPSGDTLDGLEESMPPATRDAVRRILQESITNAVRHSPSSSTIGVEFARDSDGDAVHVRIRNDVDRDAAPSDVGGGRGRDIMQTRAEAVGGRCRSAPDGDGWLVELEIPAPDQSPGRFRR